MEAQSGAEVAGIFMPLLIVMLIIIIVLWAKLDTAKRAVAEKEKEKRFENRRYEHRSKEYLIDYINHLDKELELAKKRLEDPDARIDSFREEANSQRKKADYYQDEYFKAEYTINCLNEDIEKIKQESVKYKEKYISFIHNFKGNKNISNSSSRV